MALVKQFDDFINEAKGNPKKYKQFWDKGPETQIRRKFGKDYEKSINNRVNLLLTIVDDPDKAEEYAEMDFLSLPSGISTQLVNMDPKEIDIILDDAITMNQMRGESVDEMLDGEKLYKEIKKDRKTKMNSDIGDGSILFYHDDIRKGKAEVNVDGWTGDITIEVYSPGKHNRITGEWYGDQVKNMKDIDKQLKRYIKDEKGGEFEDMGESVDEKLSSSDIKKATQAIKDYVKKLGRRADGEVPYVAAEIANELKWNEKKRSELETYLLSINNSDDQIIFGESLTESMLNEARANTAKAALRNASDALTQTIPGSKLPKAYVKDYLESLERMARKLPQLFVKQYGDFTINDYIEDVEYNLQNESANESLNEAKYEKGIEKATTMKDVMKLYPKAKTTSEVHGAVFYIELEKDLFAKAFSEDTRRDIEPFKIEGVYKMKGKRQEWLYTESVNEASDKDKPYFDFLLALRDSGATNMFGAAPYLQSEFGMSKSEARKVLTKWMKSFNESVNEAKVTEKTIDGLTDKLAKIVKELKENFLLYKKAKTDADKKKWTKRAGELTKLKQLVDSELEQAIQSFHKDIEYDEAYESLLESTIGIKTDRSFKPVDLSKALDKAKIKYKMNRLSMTLSVLDLDKKYFDDAQKIVKDLGLSIMMAKESKVNEGKINEGTDLGEWIKGGKDADKNVLVTQFTGPASLNKEFYRSRKCIQVNVGMEYITLNMNDVDELTQILNRYL